MPLVMYPKCWRGRDDCSPIHCIEATDDGVTEEQHANLDFVPLSFICSGLVKTDKRIIPQDCYRLCFKSDIIDDMSDNDIQDLAHLTSVIAAAMSLDATERVNTGTIEVPTEQGNDENG